MGRVLRSTALVTLALLMDLSPGETCGDKFLRVGRGARFQRGYVAIHPACILLYVNPHAAATPAMRELEPALKRAGHKPAMVETPLALVEALKTGHYNVVVADLADVPTVQAQARSLTASPAILPVIEKPTPAARSEAKREYTCVVETPGKKDDALASIDELMEHLTPSAPSAKKP